MPIRLCWKSRFVERTSKRLLPRFSLVPRSDPSTAIFFFGATGLIVAGLLGGSFWSLAAMCLATIGFYGSKGPFWALPSTFLTGTAAAAGMALINSVGNIGGFMGPFLVGSRTRPEALRTVSTR